MIKGQGAPPMDQFVTRENIRHFRDQLEGEIGPIVRSLLHRLLIAEEDRLGRDSDILQQIEAEIVKAKARVSRQQALVAAMKRNGRDTLRAIAVLNSLSDGVLQFEDFRQQILIALGQTRSL